VRSDGAIRSLEDLRGKRVGMQDWTQTGTIYVRGQLAHQAKVPLASIRWVFAGVNSPRSTDEARLAVPPGLQSESRPGCTLNDLLLEGEIDAILSTPPPRGYGKGVVRLFEDFEAVEEAYFRKTGIFPIMHLVAIKSDVLQRHPWLALSLYNAFEEAKRRSIARLSDISASHAPLAWMKPYSERMRRLFGEDIWPYGVDKNRTTLEAFLQYGYEQGICRRKLSPEELFPAQVLEKSGV
jgi:4,5-dihydroxyphthalate decarboxylase